MLYEVITDLCVARVREEGAFLVGLPDGGDAGAHRHRGVITSYSIHYTKLYENSGTVGAGDVQWMTSGSGILHEEMPRPKNGKMHGFQLWVNLPANRKMTRPRYQDVPSFV